MFTQLFHTPAIGLGMGITAAVIVIWSLFWKGWALWLAARRGEKIWFIILLIVNTVGILEIIYIFAVAKQQDHVHHNHVEGADAHHHHDHAHEAHSGEHHHDHHQ